MRDGPTDRIEYVVEHHDDGWAVYSLVMTNFGSMPAKNFIVSNANKKWCEGTKPAAGCETELANLNRQTHMSS